MKLPKKDTQIIIDSALFISFLTFFHLYYEEHMDILRTVWNAFITGYIPFKFSIYIYMSTKNNTSRLLLLFIGTARLLSMFYFIGSLIFDYETVIGGPNFFLLGISAVSSYVLSKPIVNLHIQKLPNGRIFN